MKWILLAAAMLAAGCSSAATTHAASTPAAAALPAGCSAALAALPSVPATAQQAARDYATLGGRKGTTLDSLLDKVAADSFDIGMDLDTGGNVSSAVAAFKADGAAVRSYCT